MDTTNKVIGFGGDAANNPTPKAIKMIYRGLMVATGIFTLVAAAYPTIPQSVQLNVLKASGLLTTVVYFICQQFGWVLPKKDNGQA